MTNIGQVPNRPSGGDVRSIAAILADFDYITNDYNGNIDANNIATSFKNMFLKLKATADRKIAFGTGVWNWGGGFEASTVVAHGLGVVPIFAIAVPTNGGTILNSNGSAPGVICGPASSLGAVNVTFVGEVGFATGGNTNFMWAAIG